MTHRMEPFFSIWLKELNPFQYYSKNWTLFNKWLEELNIFSTRTFSIWLKRWKFSFLIWRVEPTFLWFTDLTFIDEMSQIFEPFLNMTQRIELFSSVSHNWALFFNWLTEWNFLKLLLELILQKNSERIERIELWKNWKNWTLLGYHSKDWTFFVENMTQRTFFFAQFDWKNCSFLFSWLQYLDLFHMTQRIEPSFLRDSNTWTFLKTFDSKKWTLFFRTQSFFTKKKLTELNFCESDPQNWIFVNTIHRIDAFFQYDSLNWTLF